MKFGNVSVDTMRLADLSYSLALTLDYGFSSSFAWKKRCDVRAESCGALGDATVLLVMAISANRNVWRGQSRGGIEYAERMWQPPRAPSPPEKSTRFCQELNQQNSNHEEHVKGRQVPALSSQPCRYCPPRHVRPFSCCLSGDSIFYKQSPQLHGGCSDRTDVVGSGSKPSDHSASSYSQARPCKTGLVATCDVSLK
jgi:hypothetical protein